MTTEQIKKYCNKFFVVANGIFETKRWEFETYEEAYEFGEKSNILYDYIEAGQELHGKYIMIGKSWRKNEWFTIKFY